MHGSVIFVVKLDARSRLLENNSFVYVRMVNVLMLLIIIIIMNSSSIAQISISMNSMRIIVYVSHHYT